MLLSHGRKQTTQTSPYKVNISASRRGDINVKSSTVSCSRAMTWHHTDRTTATRCAPQILSNGNRTRHFFFIFVVFFFTKMFLYLTEVAVVVTPHGFRPDTTHAVLLARPTPTSSRKRHQWLQQRHNSTRLQQRSSKTRRRRPSCIDVAQVTFKQFFRKLLAKAGLPSSPRYVSVAITRFSHSTEMFRGFTSTRPPVQTIQLMLLRRRREAPLPPVMGNVPSAGMTRPRGVTETSLLRSHTVISTGPG